LNNNLFDKKKRSYKDGGAKGGLLHRDTRREKGKKGDRKTQDLPSIIRAVFGDFRLGADSTVNSGNSAVQKPKHRRPVQIDWGGRFRETNDHTPHT